MTSILQRCFSFFVYLTVIQLCLANSNLNSNSAELVKLDVYYESLCPYSANFIVNDLPKIFENGVIDIVDLRFYPWGNAHLTSNNSFSCQHGPAECLLNTIEACAIDAWPLDDHGVFIYCVEKLAYNGEYTQWETCFKKLSLDPKPVTDCYKGGKGKKLELKYAALTSALKPPHEYVPWIVVDGKPLLEDYEDYISFICKAYKGTPPSACKEQSFASVRRDKTKHAHRVCYAKSTAKTPFLMRVWSFMTSWTNLMM